MQYMRLDRAQQRDFLAELASMPDFVESAFAALAPGERSLRGADGSFSPIEHVWHLADLERQGFAERIRRLLLESDPQLPDFAGARIAREGNYRQRCWTEGLAAFRQARADNLQRLDALDGEQWLRRGVQQGVGPVAMCDMPSLMAEHDDAHRAEIAQWLEARRAGSHPGDSEAD